MSADGLKGVHEDFIIRCRCAAEYEQMIDTLLALVIGATPLAVLPRIAPILLILRSRRASRAEKRPRRFAVRCFLSVCVDSSMLR